MFNHIPFFKKYILSSFNIQCFTRRRELSVYLMSWSTCIHHNYFAHVLICECKMCEKKRKKRSESKQGHRNPPRSLQSCCSVLQRVSAIMWPYLELRGLLCSEQHAACFCYHAQRRVADPGFSHSALKMHCLSLDHFLFLFSLFHILPVYVVVVF